MAPSSRPRLEPAGQIERQIRDWTPLVRWLLERKFKIRADSAWYEDSMQDGLIGAWQVVRVHGEHANSTLIGTVACRRITDGLRSRLGRYGQRNVVHEQIESPMPGEERRELAREEGGYQMVEFRDGYERLTPRQRAVCIYLMNGYTGREIAQALGVTESRISQIWRQIKRDLS